MIHVIKVSTVGSTGTEHRTALHETQIVVLLSALKEFIVKESRYEKSERAVEIAEGLIHLFDPEGKYQ